VDTWSIKACRRASASARFLSWPQYAFFGNALVVQRQQRRLARLGQRGVRDVEAQVHRARHLVDVLPARALGADHAEFHFALVKRDFH